MIGKPIICTKIPGNTGSAVLQRKEVQRPEKRKETEIRGRGLREMDIMKEKEEKQ